MSWILAIIISFLFNQEIVDGKSGFGGTEQEWDFIEVRPGVHMFWWLYYVNPPGKPNNFDVYSKPLIIWLQGGPGYGSSGLGNFMEFGPLDTEGKHRDTTWVDDYNVLLIDAPAGAGFSHVDDPEVFSTTDDMIITDILSVINGFLEKFPKFQNVPTYIVGQSYGGKVTVRTAWALHTNNKGIPINLQGIGLIAPAISIVDSIVDWPNFAYYMGLVDNAGRTEIQKETELVKKLCGENNWEEAKEHTDMAIGKLFDYTETIDVNNVQRRYRSGAEFGYDIEELHIFMNTQVKKVLGLPHDFGEQSDKAYSAIEKELLTPSFDIVASILKETSLKIALVGGEADFMVGVTGLVTWVDRLFKDDPGWEKAPRTALVVDGIIEGYQKHYDRFSFYSVLRAGHRVPGDNGIAAKEILRKLTES